MIFENEASTGQEDGLFQIKKWCKLLVKAYYGIIFLNLAVHILWYFIAGPEHMVTPNDIYWRNYVLLSTLCLLIVTAAVDLLIRFSRFTPRVKAYAVLLLILFICCFLAGTHRSATALLTSFALPVLASTMFAEHKITNRMFVLSLISLILSALRLNHYSSDIFDVHILMQACTSVAMLACSYLIARVMIQYGQSNRLNLNYYRKDQEYLQELLKRDTFTGLYNKRTFDDYMAEYIEHCNAGGKSLVLAVMDIDWFKQVNDTYGHAVGDRVLLRLSHILKRNTSENIYAFRVGGDEFAILFKEINVDGASRICNGMRAMLEASTFAELAENKITFSCGIADMNQHNNTAEALFYAADRALYAAKDNGRNRIMLNQGTGFRQPC